MLLLEHEREDPDRFAVKEDVSDRYARWLPIRATDARSVFLVAEAPDINGLAGFVVGSIESSIPIYRTHEFGWIHDLYVLPSARRRGIARALVIEAVSRFGAMGMTQVRLETAGFNDAARATFAAAGFRTSSIEMLKAMPSGSI